MMGKRRIHPIIYAVGKVLIGRSQNVDPEALMVAGAHSQCITAATGRKKRKLRPTVRGKPCMNKSLPYGVILSSSTPRATGRTVQRHADAIILSI